MKSLHEAVLMLGTRTGWTHAEIMALPHSTFEFYTQTLVALAKPED